MTLRCAARRLLIACSLLVTAALGGASTGPRPRSVPQCAGVTLSAAYLARVSATESQGFLLVITNDRDQPVRLAKPFPTSVHWYAQAGSGRWLWRASSGSGGALVNAMQEHGPLSVYAAPSTAPVGYLVVGAHQHLEVAESMRSSPVLRFRPGCERCRNPEDNRFRAVLAYAYLPAPGSSEQGLLPCGLRSGPIVMPPLP